MLCAPSGGGRLCKQFKPSHPSHLATLSIAAKSFCDFPHAISLSWYGVHLEITTKLN